MSKRVIKKVGKTEFRVGDTVMLTEKMFAYDTSKKIPEGSFGKVMSVEGALACEVDFGKTYGLRVVHRQYLKKVEWGEEEWVKKVEKNNKEKEVDFKVGDKVSLKNAFHDKKHNVVISPDVIARVSGDGDVGDRVWVAFDDMIPGHIIELEFRKDQVRKVENKDKCPFGVKPQFGVNQMNEKRTQLEEAIVLIEKEMVEAKDRFGDLVELLNKARKVAGLNYLESRI